MAQKPGIPKGTRDFSPVELAKRNYIFDTIKKHFQTFGFQPIETPSFENSETLMGKYGDEGDRLIFKILNSGEFLRSFNENLIKTIKTAIYNLGVWIRENENVDIYEFKTDFIEKFPSVLRSLRDIKFDETSINLDNLTKDIWFRIEKIVLKHESLKTKLLKDDNESLTQLTNIVYGDFYFNLGSKYVGNYISEKALRYDLTVPFARYVVMHQNEIDFPFKRYQIQPVWRADRPQKGRFREFFQCDADVVGSTSLWQEVEFVQLYDAVFNDLGVEGVTIKMNNRKILSGIAEVIGAQDKLIDFTVALDKLDKIGEDGVKKEMLEKGIEAAAIEKVQPLFSFTGSNTEKLAQLQTMLATSVTGLKGVEELQFIINAIETLGLQQAMLDIDVTLARGLNYYTGAIFEVAAPKTVKIGSIGGGGRYDDLTGIFGLKDMSGVGISFGLDRIFLVLEELNLFPETVHNNLDVLFINFGENEAMASFKLLQQLRKAGYKADIYPDAAKPAKQFKYADKRGIPNVITIGSSELADGTFTIKNMQTGKQQTLKFEALLTAFNE